MLKYINPKSSLKSNSNNSPNGYATKSTRTIKENKKQYIELDGWGNSRKCIYDIGKHRIEVYVEDYLIHSVNFTIELAPSEKLELKIKEEKKLLQSIKNKNYLKLEIQEKKKEIKKNKVSNYFQKEIEDTKTQISEIKKFKLFRKKITKESQLSSAKENIQSLIKKNEEKKESIDRKLSDELNIIELKAKEDKEGDIKKQERIIKVLEQKLKKTEY